MDVEFMCGLLANYSKELSEAETYRQKGDVQLKHAKLILDKVKNCAIPAVSGQSELLRAYFKWHKEQGYLSHKDSDIDDFIASNCR